MMRSLNWAPWWALCRREWLEHRIALGWAPLVLLILVVVAMSLIATTVGASEQSMSNAALQSFLLSLAIPFTWLYLATGVLVLLACLIEERKDRTILFWKTMPVTDTASVLSKLFVVCAMGSIVSAGAIICAQGFALILASLVGPGADSATDAFSAVGFALSSSVHWLLGYLSQIFWLLPLWGWLLLVSSVARSLPLFWATAIPAVVVFLEWLLFRTDHVPSSIMRHIDLRALPTHIAEHADLTDSISSLPEGGLQPASYLHLLNDLWTSSDMWLGILTGCLFISAAVFCRARNAEL